VDASSSKQLQKVVCLRTLSQVILHADSASASDVTDTGNYGAGKEAEGERHTAGTASVSANHGMACNSRRQVWLLANYIPATTGLGAVPGPPRKCFLLPQHTSHSEQPDMPCLWWLRRQNSLHLQSN
jgi:hypothetical protein